MLLYIFHLPGTTANADLPVRKRNGLLCSLLCAFHLEEPLASPALLSVLLSSHFPMIKSLTHMAGVCSPEGLGWVFFPHQQYPKHESDISAKMTNIAGFSSGNLRTMHILIKTVAIMNKRCILFLVFLTNKGAFSCPDSSTVPVTGRKL